MMVSIILYHHDRLLFPSAVACWVPKKPNTSVAASVVSPRGTLISTIRPQGPAMIWCFQVRFQWVNWQRKIHCVKKKVRQLHFWEDFHMPSHLGTKFFCSHPKKSNKIETWMWQFTKVGVCFTLTHTYLGVSKNRFTMLYPPFLEILMGW